MSVGSGFSRSAVLLEEVALGSGSSDVFDVDLDSCKLGRERFPRSQLAKNCVLDASLESLVLFDLHGLFVLLD